MKLRTVKSFELFCCVKLFKILLSDLLIGRKIDFDSINTGSRPVWTTVKVL